jgi:predicted dehydrogenase
MDPLRIGIVGAQFAAHFHMQNYARLRGWKITIPAVASRTRTRAEELAKKYHIPEVADDFRRLLDQKDIDVVDLCVPTDLHHEFIIQAAKAGWNFASPDEDWVRGYPQELEDFVECLLTGREPDSGLDLAFQTVEAIYAAYLSAEKGMRVELEKRPPLTT